MKEFTDPTKFDSIMEVLAHSDADIITLCEHKCGHIAKKYICDGSHMVYSVEYVYDPSYNISEIIKTDLCSNTVYTYDKNHNVKTVRYSDGRLLRCIYDIFNKITCIKEYDSEINIKRNIEFRYDNGMWKPKEVIDSEKGTTWLHYDDKVLIHTINSNGDEAYAKFDQSTGKAFYTSIKNEYIDMLEKITSFKWGLRHE